MRKLLAISTLFLFLSGCGVKNNEMNTAMAFRQKLLQCHGCQFDCIVTADYADSIYTFTMSCKADTKGDIQFSVQEPKTISGIEGKITGDGGGLTFDGEVLAFPPMMDGYITPAVAPWVMIKTLRSGYITSCGKDGKYIRLTIDDSYADDALHLDIWLNESHLPVRAEILYDGRRTLSLDVKNFTFM